MAQRIKRILLAGDLSEGSSKLLRVAVDLATLFRAQMTVLYVFRPAEYLDAFRESGVTIDEYMSRLRDMLRDQLASVSSSHEPEIPLCLEVSEALSVSQEILITAAWLRSDVIVMGTHGHSAIRAVLGSVAEEVLREATCPVFVVPITIIETAPRTVEGLRQPAASGKDPLYGRADGRPSIIGLR